MELRPRTKLLCLALRSGSSVAGAAGRARICCTVSAGCSLLIGSAEGSVPAEGFLLE